MKPTRRSFLTALAALPFVGSPKAVAAKKSPPTIVASQPVWEPYVPDSFRSVQIIETGWSTPLAVPDLTETQGANPWAAPGRGWWRKANGTVIISGD